MSETAFQPDELGSATSDVSVVPVSMPSSDSSTEEFQPLDPRIIKAERTANWIFFAILAFGGFLAQSIYSAFNWPPGILAGAMAIAYLLVLIFLVWASHFYPVRAYRNTAWRLSELGLEIRRGVWWKHEITIPRTRVQHTDVHQGPLMRKFGLARLVIHTAGTEHATVALDGLAFETAERLRNDLVAACSSGPAAREGR